MSPGLDTVLQVGARSGDPDTPWTLEIDVLPLHFPEGDDDDSAR